MEIAPLIHSRTLKCDFNPNFAVRADDVDVSQAMKKILAAMSDVDILNGVRRLVASNGKIYIAGIAGNFRFFAEKYLKSSEAEEAEKYFYDERGREIKIFLGYSFKDGNKNEIPDVNYSTLWKFFKENLAPEWEYTTSKTVIVGYESCSTKNFSDKTNLKHIGGISFAESSESNDEKLFAQCLAERKNLCTNVDQMKIIDSGEFEVISTTQSLMNRFESESEKKNPVPQQNTPTQIRDSTTGKDITRRLPKKKENLTAPALMIGGAIVAIILIAILLLK